MRRTAEEIKAELIAEAHAAIEELVTWEREAGAPDLTALEDKVLAVRQRFGQRLLAVLIEDQAVRQPAAPPPCMTCGTEMRYKGQKGTVIESRVGGLEIARGYYYCARCGSGVFPPG